MNIIKLDGQEYILRCDLNVLEKIHRKYGNIADIDISDIESIKEITAWMVNEQYYYTGEVKSVTPDFIGSKAQGSDFAGIVNCITKEIIDSMTVKN